jgi:hypothetical protein
VKCHWQEDKGCVQILNGADKLPFPFARVITPYML